MAVPPQKFSPSSPVFLALFLIAWAWPTMGFGHVSEQAFVLLLPTDVYITAGCISVFVSIIVVTLLPPHSLDKVFAPKPVGFFSLTPKFAQVTSIMSMLVFFALCLIGITGPRDPLTNLLPLSVWTGFWIIFFTAIGVVGNFWPFLNPWTGICSVFEHKDRNPLVKLPEAIGCTPAIFVFLGVFGFSIADPAPADPDRLAMILLGYWCANLLAMLIFGREDWMRRGEAFSVLFTELSKVALLGPDRGLRIGVPGWQLVKDRPLSITIAAFSLILLGAGSFDGLKETFWWMGLIGVNPLEFPGRTAVITSSLVGMILCIIALICGFLVMCGMARWLAIGGSSEGKKPSLSEVFCAFAPLVLPIALAFHASHFTISFLVDGQYLLAAIGDPLATGSNFLKLGQTTVTTGFLGTTDSVRSIWLAQAGIVVFGHILAVVLSHKQALHLFGNVRAAAMSQIPFGAFMVFYTLFGLWLLATPRGV